MTCPHCDGTGKLPADEMHIGIVMVRARRRLQKKQMEIAKQVGISRTTYANLETGRQLPTVNYVRALAKALKIKVEDLLP